MNWKCLIVLCGCGLLSGCGSSGPVYTDHKNPELYAEDVKRVVLTQAAEARKSKEPADDLGPVVAELEGHASRPQGDYAELYATLLSKSLELQQACAAIEGRPSDLNSRLDELVELAQQLPGEVVVSLGD
jgi:hypothetical protein